MYTACIHTVCKMVHGIYRENKVYLPSCVTAVIRENLILLTFLDSNIHKHENFKLTVLHGHIFYHTLTLCW